jgi:RNA polymerase primary sigma factor
MAKKINVGLQNYLKQIREIPLLTVEQERELARRAQAGDMKAKNQLVSANLRLVVMAAKQYNQNTSLSFEDLIQEGNTGLMRATEDFNPDLGYRFSTYAMHWIKQAISKAIANNSRTIRIPVHILELQSKYRKAEEKLRVALGRKPTEEELSKELDLAVSKVKEIQSVIKDPISIHTQLNDENDGTIEDLIADPHSEDFDKNYDNKLLSNVINSILDTLDTREQEIIIARFGLNGAKVKTLDQLGEEYGVTKERIRQIEQKALVKLRNPRRAEMLKPYYA